MTSLLAGSISGLIIGSFIAMLSYRLPLMLQRQWRLQAENMLALPASPARARLGLSTPASHCPHCRHRLSAWENIPVVSYLILWGRCRACRAPIGWRYPLLELLAATAAIMVFWTYGFGLQACAMLLFSWGLLLLGVIDQEHFLLPDCLVLPLLWAGLLINWNGLFVPLEDALRGAVYGYLCLWLLYWVFRALTGKDGMGRGDFKLLAMLGAWAGYSALPSIMLIASLSALSFTLISSHHTARQRMIPFGPYLAAGGWITLLWQEQIAAYWRDLTGNAIW